MSRPRPAVAPSTRRFVYAFLAVFVLCGLLSVEVWPLTGWRLYHERRTAVRRSWDVTAVLPDGAEEVIRLGELPLGWHNTTRLIAEFPDLPAAERDEICAAWAQPARDAGTPVVVVRVYSVTTDLSDPSARARALRYECGAAS